MRFYEIFQTEAWPLSLPFRRLRVSLLQSQQSSEGINGFGPPSIFKCTISENSRNSHNFLKGCNLCLLYGLFLMSRNLLAHYSLRRCSLRPGLKWWRPFSFKMKLSRSAARRSHYMKIMNHWEILSSRAHFPRLRGLPYRCKTSKYPESCSQKRNMNRVNYSVWPL